MTRKQFNANFAINEKNTEGFSDEELAKINSAVFASVSGLDASHYDTKNAVEDALKREFEILREIEEFE